MIQFEAFAFAEAYPYSVSEYSEQIAVPSPLTLKTRIIPTVTTRVQEEDRCTSRVRPFSFECPPRLSSQSLHQDIHEEA